MSTADQLLSIPRRLAGSIRPRSIRIRLLAILLVLALGPLALVGFMASSQGKRLLQESIGSNLEEVARAVVSSLDQKIEQRRQSVEALAIFPLVVQTAAAGSTAFPAERRAGLEAAELAYAARPWEENPVARTLLSQMLARVTEISEDLSQTLLTDQDGWVVAASGQTEDYYQADETWWFRAFSGGCGRTYVDDLEQDASVGDQVAGISVPVCMDSRVVGVLKSKVALSRILHMVTDLDLAGVARVWIIKNNGAAVAALDGNRLDRIEATDAKPAAEVARRIVGSVSGYLQASMADVPSVIGYASSTGAGQFHGLGWIILVVEPVSRAYAPVVRFQQITRALSALMVVLVLVVGIRASSHLTRPIRTSTQVAQAIAQGDLVHQVRRTGQEELDVLADGINVMTQNLRQMVGSIRRAAVEVETVSQIVASNSDRVLAGTQDQISQVEETTGLMTQADSSLEEVSRSLTGMVSATDQCSGSILEMDANIGEIVRSTEALSSTTDATLASVEEMVQSIKEVNGGVESLRSLAESSAASVSQMEAAIQRVEQIAQQTAQATDRAAGDAEVGRQAVDRTVAGMGEIERAASQTAVVIRRLTEQVGKIGGILQIIGDVADQTNQQALNASILAAQAGEHGGGFAVVATEIKELADRTARSTKEITLLIQSIQAGAREAGEAMAAGLVHVNDGVARSREAGDALEKILAGTRESSKMSREIVVAAADQASQSRQMTGAISRINDTTGRIASTTQQQSRGCSSILQASEQVRDLTALVRRAILDQRQASRRISDSVERITIMAKAIDTAGHRQKGLSESVVGAMVRIGTLSGEHVEALSEMHGVIRSLTTRAEDLRRQIARFRDDA